MDENARILQQILEALKSQNSGGGSSFGGFDGLTKAGKTLEQEAASQALQMKRMSENISKMNKITMPTADGMRSVQKAGQQLSNDLERVRGRVDELNDVLQKADEKFVKLDAATRDSIEQELKFLNASKTMLAHEENKQKTLSALHTVGSGAISYLAQQTQIAAAGMSAMVGAIQSGGSGFALFGAAANMAADMANASAQAGARATETAGGALIQMGGKAAIAGTFLSLLGQAASAAAEAATQARKLQNQIFMQAGESISKSFMTAAGSGALFAKGADGMADALKGSRLLLNDLGEVIKNNSASLAASGLGMETAVRQIGRVGAVMKNNGMADNLMQLGISYKDQADIMATVMSDMRTRDPGAAMSDSVIAQRTKEYAQNLSAISAITGEDAKKKMEEAKKTAMNLGFQQKLNEMGTENSQKIMDATGHMSTQMQKDFQDMLMRGRITNSAGAHMASQIPEYQAMMDAAAIAAKNGTLTGEKMAELNAQYGPLINKTLMSAKGLGNAAHATDGTAREIATNSVEMNNHMKKYTKQAVDGLKKNQDDIDKKTAPGAKKDADTPLTNAVMGAAQTMNDFQKSMEDYVIKNMGKWATAQEEALKKMKDAYMGIPAPVPGVGKLGEFFLKYGQYIMMAIQAMTLLVPVLALFKGKAAEAANSIGGVAEKSGKVTKGRDGRYRDSKGRFAKAPASRFSGMGGMATKAIGGAAIVGTLMNVAGAVGDVSDKQAEYNEAKASGDQEGMNKARAAQGASVGGAVGSVAGGALGMALGGPIGAAVGAYLGDMAGSWMGEKVGPYWDKMSEGASQMVTSMGKWASETTAAAGKALGEASTWVSSKLSESGAFLTGKLSEAATGAMGLVTNVASAAKETFPALTGALGSMLSTFDSGASKVINNVMTAGKDLYEKAAGAFDSAKGVLGGLMDSMKEKMAAAKDWAANAWNKMTSSSPAAPAASNASSPNAPNAGTAAAASKPSAPPPPAPAKPADTPKPVNNKPLPSQQAAGDVAKLQAAMADALERLARIAAQQLAVSENILKHTR